MIPQNILNKTVTLCLAMTIFTLAGLLALCLAVPAGFGAEPPASKPPAMAPATAATLRERIDHDYLMQFLVYQRREIASGKIPLLTTDADAAGAVDGIKDGKAGFHTNLEVSPWWQVDLGDQGPIAKVRIYNLSAIQSVISVIQ